MARRSTGEDPLKGDEEIIREFFKPSKGEVPLRRQRVKSAKSVKSTAKEPEKGLVKATFYLAQKHIIALEELRLKLMKQRGRRVDKSELVREAIELLVEHYSK